MSGQDRGERRIGERRSSKARDENTRLRALERVLRDFILYVRDKPRDLFAPRTLAMVDESEIIVGELDRLRSEGGPQQPAT
ncbi:MAG TPA: hypothetical protein VGX48_17755 [Pyrinomonadaceae bacterium]|jgi:hypothetical protein|nr:hypothetical protein [Pyrinomonadaceae bacterium]